MNCPICNSIPIPEQPYPGLHAYTTIFQCGCETIQTFSDEHYIIYEQRCDEAVKPKLDVSELFKKSHPKNI